MPRIYKKLVLVLAISISIIKTSKKNMVLNCIPCIYYPVLFKKDKLKALINFGSKFNAMMLAYTLKLNLKLYSTNIRVQKIDSAILKIFEIVMSSFQIEINLEKAYFF